MNKQEICIECNQPTGNAGEMDGSLYVNGKGPYCDVCHGPAIFDDYDRLKAENERLRSHLSAIGIVAISEESSHIQFGRIGEIVRMALESQEAGK